MSGDSSKLRVVVLAFSVNGAMGQYLHCMLESVGKLANVVLVAPSHYSYRPAHYEFRAFRTGPNRLAAAARLLNPVSILEVFRQIAGCSPDVVHHFNGEACPASLCCPTILHRRRVPLVTTVHDVHPHSGDPLMQVVAVLRRRLLRSSQFLHVHSARCIPALAAQAIPPERVRVIPHGSFAPIYNPDGARALTLDRKTVLFFGRLQPYKGIDTLIEAAQRIDRSHKIVIAGPGTLPQNLLRRIREDPRIELHNRYLSDSEVASLFRNASVTVLPYLDATQSSVPLISASFGVPVVASAVGAFLEDIPKVDGLLVPPKDSMALAKAIETALGSVATNPKDLQFSHLAHQFIELYSGAIRFQRDSLANAG